MEWDDRKESLYYQLNYDLRLPGRPTLERWRPYLRLLLTALCKAGCTSRLIWRGVKDPKGEKKAEYKVGQEVRWWALSSCTSKLETLTSNPQFFGTYGDRTLFCVLAERAVSIAEFSTLRGEDEYVLLPGTRLEVLGVGEAAPHLRIVVLREAESSFAWSDLGFLPS